MTFIAFAPYLASGAGPALKVKLREPPRHSRGISYCSLEKTLMSWPRPAQLISSLCRLSDAIQQQFAAVHGDLSLIEFAERLLMRRRIEHCD